MKRKIKKPFDVEAAKRGAKVVTRSGSPVRIICYSRVGNPYSIVALVNRGDVEVCEYYTATGHYYETETSEDDLFIIEEVKCPRFNEGDYVVSDTGNIHKIIKIDDNMYHTKRLLSDYEQRWTIEDVDRAFHKWTLSDAKPGDVLCYNGDYPFMFKELCDGYPVAYFGIDMTDHILVDSEDIWTKGSVRPATLKEYDSLYKQLKEENYEYNSDTHEITKQKAWRYREGIKLNGYYIESADSNIRSYNNGVLCDYSYDVFATEKQAKAALAMARISQIMANDKRFGGIITDEEWNGAHWHVITRLEALLVVTFKASYNFLAFHTREQAELFLEENKDLVKDYYMLD